MYTWSTILCSFLHIFVCILSIYDAYLHFSLVHLQEEKELIYTELRWVLNAIGLDIYNRAAACGNVYYVQTCWICYLIVFVSNNNSLNKCAGHHYSMLSFNTDTGFGWK